MGLKLGGNMRLPRKTTYFPFSSTIGARVVSSTLPTGLAAITCEVLSCRVSRWVSILLNRGPVGLDLAPANNSLSYCSKVLASRTGRVKPSMPKNAKTSVTSSASCSGPDQPGMYCTISCTQFSQIQHMCSFMQDSSTPQPKSAGRRTFACTLTHFFSASSSSGAKASSLAALRIEGFVRSTCKANSFALSYIGPAPPSFVKCENFSRRRR
mmetsp:Transcript_59053/g.126925  ORF Transcript_59053/g.126925 Transcript_59053/m.126925 type:complete len:211 (-) Transcript_59053:297-929(-)